MNHISKLGLFIITTLVFVGCTSPEPVENTEPVNESTVTSQVSNTETDPEWKGTQVTITAQELIDAGIDPTVRMWQSYDNRSMVGTLSDGVSVTLEDYDKSNDYCEVTKVSGEKGWIGCEWIANLPF